MRRPRTWLLPLLLALTQLALWPGIPALTGDRLDRVQVAAGIAATLLANTALCWRRTAPVAALAAVVVASTLGQLGTPTDSLLQVMTADLIAFYSVAVRRPARVTLRIVAALTAWQALLNIHLYGLGREYVGAVLTTVVVYLLVAGLGRGRRRWHAARTEAADRLVRAEADRQQAAGAERRRLARELHDVSAHHLTSIVVTASAAQRLTARRPELAAEALAFAARTGRETAAALHRLVAVLRTDEQHGHQPLATRLDTLAQGHRELGQRVSVAVSVGELPRAAADAAYGIAREALTNTLRHAPAAVVRVTVGPHADGIELLVDDDGAATPPVAGLGSGRGLPGMRERAAAVGGRMTAGPRAPAGWRVRAVLPREVPPAGRSAARPSGHRLRGDRAVDTAAALGTIVVPVSMTFDAEFTGVPLSADTGALLVLLLMAHALPLLWRRTRPWTALAAVLVTSWSWPVVQAYQLLPGDTGAALVFATLAEFTVVYAVGAYGRGSWLTVLAAPATAASLGLVAATAAAVDGSLLDEPVAAPVVGFAAVGVAAGLILPLTAVWGWGFLVRTRRHRTVAREDTALARSTAEAVNAAHVERARIAAGLRDAVQDRTARLVGAAERGDLDAVVAEARAALAGMRALLAGLRAGEADGPRDPQPTAAGIAELCATYRAAGREITLDAAHPPRALPADVDVSAYRVVELALAAGDTGPAGVVLRYGPDDLRLTVSAVRAATGGATVAGLRARIGALGGRLRVADDTIDVRLPAASPTEEVTPSRSL